MPFKSFIGILLPVCGCILLAGLINTQQERNPIKLVNGGYTNILIAIQKNVPENQTIIDNIKEMFIEASSVLFTATERKVFIKNITILVPLTWLRQAGFEVARLEAYENANVQVAESTTDDHQPYVNNPYFCGREGEYIRLTSKFVADKTFRETEYGKSGKVIVQIFAELRYGVYDEAHVNDVTDDSLKPVYTDEGRQEGTRCSENVLGDLVEDGNGICQTDHQGNVSPSCRFEPHTSGQTAKASLMFATNIDSIDSFCHDRISEAGYHNYKAPNLQNKLCDYQSVWEVMRKSPDIGYDRSSLPEGTDTTPTFKIVQQAGTFRVVLVLDVSTSMNGERFDKMIKGAKHYIRNIVPDGGHVGIVEFNEEARIDSPMVEITNSTFRELLVSRLPLVPNGNTGIGAGILKGIEVLQHDGGDSQGSFLILLSDGLENQVPKINDTLTDIDDAGIIIDTIAIRAADPQLEFLSSRTGGTSSACSDGGSAQCVIDAFTVSVTLRPESVGEAVPIQVSSSTMTTLPSSPAFIEVPIDASLGLDTTMTFTWSKNVLISLTVEGPDDTFINSTDPRYNVDIDSKIITVTIEDAEAGSWKIRIDGTDVAEYVSVAVNSKPRSADVVSPLVESFIGTKTVIYTKNPVVEIYAYVYIGSEPVLGAIVTAEIDSTSTGDVTTILLQDNGQGADLIAGDGIYSVFFLGFTANGRHGVKIDVTGFIDDLGSKINERTRRFAKDVATGSTSPRPNPTLPVQSFERTVSGIIFEVEGYSPDINIDILAPSKITDFSSTEATYSDNRTITLTWTAVGDDLDQGNATLYELRFSTDFTQLHKNFSANPSITQYDILKGNLSSVASSGVKESVTIRLPGNDTNAMYSFMIRAWDEAHNTGGLSNIVSVTPRPPPPQPTTTENPTELPTTDELRVTSQASNTTVSPSSKPPFSLSSAAIIGMSVAAFLVVILIVVAMSVWCHKVKRDKRSESEMYRSKHPNEYMNNAYDTSGP